MKHEEDAPPPLELVKDENPRKRKKEDEGPSIETTLMPAAKARKTATEIAETAAATELREEVDILWKRIEKEIRCAINSGQLSCSMKLHGHPVTENVANRAALICREKAVLLGYNCRWIAAARIMNVSW